MKFPYLLLTIFFLSCADEYRVKEYSKVLGYDTVVEIKESIHKKDDFKKLEATYIREKIGNWKVCFELHAGSITQYSAMGIAQVQNLPNDPIDQPKFILVKRIVDFKKDPKGIEKRKELELNNIIPETDYESRFKTDDFTEVAIDSLKVDLIISEYNILTDQN